MYCTSCGNPIPDEARFCNRCGKAAVASLAPAVERERTRLARHLPALALLWVVYSVLRILSGGAALFVGSIFMPHFFLFGWPFSRVLLPGLITGLGVGILVLGVLGLAAGWGLWQREPWARIVALILGVLALIHFPFGTALGIYTLWVLLPNEAAVEYARPAAHI